jgi:hypothetical protein
VVLDLDDRLSASPMLVARAQSRIRCIGRHQKTDTRVVTAVSVPYPGQAMAVVVIATALNTRIGARLQALECASGGGRVVVTHRAKRTLDANAGSR